MKDDKRQSVSFSRLQLLARCGEAYRRRYEEGDVIPPMISAIRGTAVHIGSEINFKQKIKTKKDLNESDIVEATVEAFDSTVKNEGVSLTKEEQSIGKRKVIGGMKDRSVYLARIYSKEVAPAHQPIIVETLQKIQIAENVDLTIKIDLVNDKKEVVDLKTTTKPRQQIELDNDLQFDVYGLGYLAMTGKHASGFRQEVLLDTKNPKRQTITTQRTTEDYRVTVNRINAFLHATKTGCYTPTSPLNWWCSNTWCGYWQTCPYVKNK